MKGFPILHSIWLVLAIHGSLAFFHTPSYTEFNSPETSNSFGYSIGYLSSSNSLVVGDPLNGEDGKVYSCSLNGLENKTSTCENSGINIDEYAGDYNKSGSPEQKFCLGASISVTPDYFLTCSPLWSSFTLLSMFGALGTCFISNGTDVTRYFGLTEKYYAKDSRAKTSDIYGGIGWNTLSDPHNKIILIAKPVLESSISYIEMNEPMNPAKVVNWGDVLITFGYIGQGFAVGQFFDTKTLYAVSMIRRTTTTGAVVFLYYDITSKTLKIYLNDDFEPLLIEDNFVDSMYGVVLHSANLNFDNFTELLVGAPAQSNTVGGYEQGAVHIYVGGVTTKSKTKSNLCIYTTVDGSRFGTAIASTDLDGDGLAEIFISAPYEDTGVIYVFAGCEISSILHKDRNSLIPVTSLKNVQRIVHSDTKSFGVSLLSMADVDKHGLNALVIGSLNSNKVVLYRSMPTINVTVYTILDGEMVREQDKNFTVTVTVHVLYTTKQKIRNGKLFVTTNVDGVGATIENNKYGIILKENVNEYKRDVVVLFNNDEPGDYKFTATVEADNENLKRSDYDSSLYIINPYSRVRDAIDVKRRCKGDECVPKLSLTIKWTGGDDEYVLGSSEKENMTLLVRNDGNTTYQSCARVRIIGAQFKIPDCVLEFDDWYRCDFIEIPRHDTYPVEVQLDMTKMTNHDENLDLDVTLYNNCAAFGNGTVTEHKNVTYTFNTSEIYFASFSVNRNVTDSALQTKSQRIEEVYFVMNNGKVTWKSVRLEIEIKRETFINNYTVTTATSTKSCSEEYTEISLRIICIFDVNPNSLVKFLTTIYLINEEMMDYFIDSELNVTSTSTLYLEPTGEKFVRLLTTTLTYQVDAGIGNNKNLIIAISVLLGLFILLVVIIVLYKVGFFKRAEKTKLDALKEEIRRESTRRPAPKSTESSGEDSADENDLEVIEFDIPLHDGNIPNTSDFVSLIAEEKL